MLSFTEVALSRGTAFMRPLSFVLMLVAESRFCPSTGYGCRGLTNKTIVTDFHLLDHAALDGLMNLNPVLYVGLPALSAFFSLV